MYFTIRREKIMHFDKKKENCVHLISPSLRMHDGVVNMSQKETEGEKAMTPAFLRLNDPGRCCPFFSFDVIPSFLRVSGNFHYF